ncbi:MAG TPA: VOC family protein, partial [Caldilinea sp.]|nr:VOC family protein [Caldilinea sp.]
GRGAVTIHTEEETMQSRLNPYLNFRDSARQAMAFYQTVFGGKLAMNTFKDFGVSQDPAEENKIMHSMLEAENGIVFMAADTLNSWPYSQGTDMHMSLSGDNEAELRGYFEKLSQGGTIVQPLMQAPWGDIFGAVNDQFGVKWMVNISPAKA